MLSFCCTIVGLTVAGELRDIELCHAAIRRGEAAGSLGHGWCLALRLVLGMRRWFFLPSLCLIVQVLVATRGGDALSICFNVIAILFMCDIDNAAYRFGLGQEAQQRMSEVGRLTLSDAELRVIQRVADTHIAVVAVSIVTAVIMAGSGDGYVATFSWFWSLFVFWVGGVAEVAGAPDASSAAAVLRGVGSVTVSWMVGTLSFVISMVLRVALLG
eukprot:COSAG01_NODE_1299_length_10836_cov_8.277452_9_plen_215_part_00